MSEIIIVQDDTEPAADAAHVAQMEAVEDIAEEALAVATVALAAAAADDPHVCRCDQLEARLVALETATVAEEEVEVEALENAILEAELEAVVAEPVEEEMPAPPVKESKPAEDTEEKPKKAGRPGMSKGWFGSRVK